MLLFGVLVKGVLSQDFDYSVTGGHTEYTLCVEMEEIGSVGTIAFIGIPPIVIGRYVVALEDQSSPSIIDP